MESINFDIDLGNGFCMAPVPFESTIERVKSCFVLNEDSFFVLDTKLTFYFFDSKNILKRPSYAELGGKDYSFKITFEKLHEYLYKTPMNKSDFAKLVALDELRRDCEIVYLGNNKIVIKPSLTLPVAIFDFQDESYEPRILTNGIFNGFHFAKYSANTFLFSDSTGKLLLYNWLTGRSKGLLQEHGLYPMEIERLSNGFVATITTTLFSEKVHNVLFVIDPFKNKVVYQRDYSFCKIPKLAVDPAKLILQIVYHSEKKKEDKRQINIYTDIIDLTDMTKVIVSEKRPLVKKLYEEKFHYKINYSKTSIFYIFSFTESTNEIDFYRIQDGSPISLWSLPFIERENSSPFDDAVVIDVFNTANNEFLIQQFTCNEEFVLTLVRFACGNESQAFDPTFKWLRKIENNVVSQQSGDYLIPDDLFAKVVYRPNRVTIQALAPWENQFIYFVTNEGVIKKWKFGTAEFSIVYNLEDKDFYKDIHGIYILNPTLIAIKNKFTFQGCCLHFIDLEEQKIVWESNKSEDIQTLELSLLTKDQRMIVEILDHKDDRYSIAEIVYSENYRIQKIAKIKRTDIMSFNIVQDYFVSIWEVAKGIIAGNPSFNSGELHIYDINDFHLVRTKSFNQEWNDLFGQNSHKKFDFDDENTSSTFNHTILQLEIKFCFSITEELVGIAVGESENMLVIYNWKTDRSVLICPFPWADYIGKFNDLFFFQIYETIGYFNPHTLLPDDTTQERIILNKEPNINYWKPSRLNEEIMVTALYQLDVRTALIYDRESLSFGLIGYEDEIEYIQEQAPEEEDL